MEIRWRQLPLVITKENMVEHLYHPGKLHERTYNLSSKNFYISSMDARWMIEHKEKIP